MSGRRTAAPKAPGHRIQQTSDDQGSIADGRDRAFSRYRDAPFRIVALRAGKVVVDWNNQLSRSRRFYTASLGKSLFACMLGIAVSDGVIRSVDDPVVSYYPAMLDVPEGRGPKPGRYSIDEDSQITFGHLAAQVSGYLKPDELPGRTFHYQSFGPNILAHAIAASYGRYTPGAPQDEQESSIGDLILERIGNRIGASWSWRFHNFEDLSPNAAVGIFGNSVQVSSNALDLGKLGWLWRCGGSWFGEQVIPTGWIDTCAQPSRYLQEMAPEREWVYGLGFWVNHRGTLWPRLPSASFAAWGGGGNVVWVAPQDDVVIATCPFPGATRATESAKVLNEGIIPEVLQLLV